VKDLIIFLAQSLVENPDEVSVVDAGEIDGVTTYKLSVAQNEMGRIIGKQGRIAKAVRTIVKAAAIRENKQINIEIVDAK